MSTVPKLGAIMIVTATLAACTNATAHCSDLDPVHNPYVHDDIC